jgi:hypothetical protein
MVRDKTAGEKLLLADAARERNANLNSKAERL